MTNNLNELLFRSQDGIELNAVWSRRQVPQHMRIFTDAQHYLEIKMDITDPLLVDDSNFSPQDVYEDFLLDSAVLTEVPSGQCSQRYHAFIDVLLHPMYEVPCPFIRMYDCRGQLLPAVTTQSLVTRVFHRTTMNGIDTNEDGKEKNDIQFTFEEHPYLTIPCLCLHVCGVRECMAMLDLSTPSAMSSSVIPNIMGMADNSDSSSSISSSSNNTDNETRSDIYCDTYLLRWFSLVGPTIGLNISPQLFAKLSSSPCQ